MSKVVPVLILAAAGLIIFFGFAGWPGQTELTAFAACLTDREVAMYGANWCSHCQNQKNLFGAAFKKINYVECTSRRAECLAKNIQGYPTWIFADGLRLDGEQSLETLAEKSGCVLPPKN